MRQVLMISLITLSAAFMPALAAASLQGSWLGSGVVTHRRGADPVRCRVTFSKVSATSFAVSSQCTTKTGRYEVAGRVASSGANRYSGQLQGQGQGGRTVIVRTAIASRSR
jgi:hypothetical protein